MALSDGEFMKSAIEIFAAIGACCLLASPLQAATIQSFGVAPNNSLPGDLVTAFFQIDGGTPVGQAGVWIDGIEQCQAPPENGYYSCAFSVPHGGRFNYELRFRDANGVLTASTQQALSGGLRIVKFQPEIVQAGRSAIIFAKLDYFHPAAVPQPQGQIQISSLDGTHSCTIQLPQQTHCQMLFARAGRYPLRAQYSGDASYPALISAVSEIRVANPKLDHVIYANEVPLGPIVADTSFLNSALAATFNAHGNWLLMPQGGAIDYNVGAQIPLFKASPYSQAFVGPSRIFGAQSGYANLVAIASPRGELHKSFFTNGSVRSIDPLHRILNATQESLVAADNNQRIDWYLQALDSETVEWLSKKADGSAISLGVETATFNSEAIAFISSENDIVIGDQDGLPDTFIARAGHATIRLPLPASRTEAPYPVRMNAASNLLICYTALALTADDLDTQNDMYIFNTATATFRRLAEARFADVYFSPDDSQVIKENNSKLIVYSLDGTQRTLALSSLANGLALVGVTSSGQAILFNRSSNANQRLLVDLNTGAEQIASGRVVGDEALLQTRNLSLNDNGSHILTYTAAGVLTLNSDGTQRNALTAAYVANPRMDDDANYFAFSTPTALVPDDINGTTDVYEWDQRRAQLRRLTRRVDGTQTTQASQLLAYSRREGVALVYMQELDLPGTNAGLARSNLTNGSVTPVPNLNPGYYPGASLGFSRNGRWGVFRGREAPVRLPVRLDTQTGELLELSQAITSEWDFFNNAVISDDGVRIVFSVRVLNRVEVRQLNLVNQNVRTLFQTVENDVALRISSDGKHLLVGTRRYFVSPFPGQQFPPTPHKIYVIDLERELVSEKIADALNGAFDFSGDGSMIAWASFSGNEQTGSVSVRENPYFKLLTYTSIIRTVPAQPNLAQDFLVEAVVSHKEAGIAPSGVIRFDDGNGAQCDAELIPQGELAVARCRIFPNAQGYYTSLQSAPATSSALTLTITASYLGDRRYSVSQNNRSVSVSKVTPTIRWVVGTPNSVPEASIGIELGSLAAAPFTGSARITSNWGIPCFLSAVEINSATRCRFFIPVANDYEFTVTLDDPIYTLGNGSGIILSIGTPDSIFANGFE